MGYMRDKNGRRLDTIAVAEGTAVKTAPAVPTTLVARPAGQTVGTAALTAVRFTYTHIDDLGLFDSTLTSSSKVTLRSPGRYRITGQSEWASTTLTGTCALIVCLDGDLTNGRIGQVTVPAASGIQNRHQVTTGPIDLEAGDYLELYVYQTSGANQDTSNVSNSTNGRGSTWMSVEKIG